MPKKFLVFSFIALLFSVFANGIVKVSAHDVAQNEDIEVNYLCREDSASDWIKFSLYDQRNDALVKVLYSDCSKTSITIPRPMNKDWNATIYRLEVDMNCKKDDPCHSEVYFKATSNLLAIPENSSEAILALLFVFFILKKARKVQ